MLRKAVLCAALCVTASACGDSVTAPAATNPTAAPTRGASFSIYDGAHGGSDRFYFLPPLVSNPKIGPANDEAIYPALTVTICALNGTACVGDPIAQFVAPVNGKCTGLGVQCLALDGNHYVATWKSGDYATNTKTDYRATVAASGFELGHVDIDVLGKKDIAKADFIGLSKGAQLLIPFRVESGVIQSLTMTPGDASLTPGQTVQYGWSATDYSGNPATDRVAVWSSSNTSVATVDQAGKVTAVGAGSTTLTLTVDGHVATAIITVASAATSFTLSPTSVTLTLGQTTVAALHIAALGPDGPITSGLNATWTSDNANVKVTPGSDGLSANIDATQAGIAHVSVSVAGLPSQTATIAVNPPAAPAITMGGGSALKQITLSPTQLFGGPLPAGATYSFSSSDPTIVEVAPLTGVVTPRGDGTATVTLNVQAGGTLLTSSVVTITPPAAYCPQGATGALAMLPHTMHVFVSGDAPFTATVSGAPAGAQLGWSLGSQVSDVGGGQPAVSMTATTTSATITPIAPGHATVNFTVPNTAESGTGCVVVLGAPTDPNAPVPTSIRVTASTNALTIAADGTRGSAKLTASVLDASGNVMPGPFTFSWSSGSSAISVSSDGSATATVVAAAASSLPATVTVSAAGAVGFAQFTVADLESPPPGPAPFVVEPATAVCKPGQTITLTADVPAGVTVTWAQGSTLWLQLPSGGSSATGTSVTYTCGTLGIDPNGTPVLVNVVANINGQNLALTKTVVIQP